VNLGVCEQANHCIPLRVNLLSTSRRSRYFAATIVSMSTLVTGIQNSQEVTHEKNLVNSKDTAENFVRTMQGLDDRLGPLLLQLPPGFTAQSRDALDLFLRDLPKGPSYAVEVRHKSWLDSDLPDLLHEHGAALTLVDYPGMPRLEETSADFAYIRWLGNRGEFPSGHTHSKKDRTEDLRWWSGVVDRFLEEGKAVFAYANNHYQNHSPSTVEQFLELRRGDR
jgi:uncharacterized protein YecE (DUF72 family)